MGASGDVSRGTGSGTETSLPSRSHTERERRRRPVAVVAGLVLSFAVTVLFGTWLLSALGLPQDLLRWVGIVVLGIVGLGLLVPPVGNLLEYPFVKLSRGRPVTNGGGFILGLSLGLVFVPCAGPVLAAITAVGDTHHIGWSAVVLTRRLLRAGSPSRCSSSPSSASGLPGRCPHCGHGPAPSVGVIGALLVVAAVVIATPITDGLQRVVPGYTNGLQSAIEQGTSARRALAGVSGEKTTGSLANCMPDSLHSPGMRQGSGHPGHQCVAQHIR